MIFVWRNCSGVTCMFAYLIMEVVQNVLLLLARKTWATGMILWSRAAISTLRRSHLVFIEPGVKIIGAYYRDVLLAQYLLPVISNQTLEGYFIFQQDSEPAHRAGWTIEMLRWDTTDFIPFTLWPPDSTDLNPVDHKVWGMMQEQVYHTPNSKQASAC